MPALCLNISPLRWMFEPVPDEAKVSCPGLALAKAIKSLTEVIPKLEDTTRTMVP
jgi:hypothetical protein